MWVGHDVENRSPVCEELPIQWTSHMIDLVIIFDNNFQNMFKANFENELDEVKAIAKTWQRVHLTMYGKVCMIKSIGTLTPN